MLPLIAHILFLAFLLAFSGNLLSQQMTEDIKRLVTTHEKAAIPLDIAIMVEQIVDIEQKSQNFTATINLVMRYTDEKLAYEQAPGEPQFRLLRPESFKQYAESKKTIWSKIVILNQQGGKDVSASALALFPDGEVYFTERLTTTFQAPDFDFRRFPFDDQTFEIKVRPLLPKNHVYLREWKGGSGLGYQLGEEEWIPSNPFVEINDRQAPSGLLYSEFTLGFTAKRHLTYYILRIFMPMFLILMVSWFTFRLKDYMKRVDISITVLLLFIAFNFTLSTDLPRLGYITAMDAFMSGAFLITGCVVLVNVYLRQLQVARKEDFASRLDRYVIIAYWPAYVLGMSAAFLLL